MADGKATGLSAVHALVASCTGSSLSPHQRARLDEGVARLRQGRSDEDFLALISSPKGEAVLQELMATLCVHKTDLFRDAVQLDAFAEHVLPKLPRGRPLSVWSAGCATGEEVATLLMLLAEVGASPDSLVLGTDLSRTVLERARKLTFSAEVMRPLSAERRERFFAQPGAEFQLHPRFARQARFERHNLMDTPYPSAPPPGFDIIFCRNVLIYFTEAAFDRTVQLLAERLAPGGVLVLSAAEPILRPQPLLDTQRLGGAFFYFRRAVETGPRPAPQPVRAAPPVAAPVSLADAPPGASFGLGLPRPAAAIEPEVDDPLEESRLRFGQVLAWASAGREESETEAGLRQCLYLDPHFAQARYLLGMLLEGRGLRGDAATEYRRALAALVEGKAKPAPFFLNEERLKLACLQSLKRLAL